MESSTQYSPVGNINLPSATEESLIPSLEYAESPISKRRIFAEFPTEETSHLRSLNSPHTASSTLPYPKETFYDKVRETLLNNGVTRKLRHLRQKSESLRLETPLDKRQSTDEGLRYTLPTEPYELDINNDVPTLMWCAYCQGERRTDTTYVNTSKTFWSAVAIFLVGGVAGCFLCPYATNHCKKPLFVCSRCGHKLN